MKTPPDENQIVRWLDGEMDAAEKAAFEAHLSADSALRAEVESLGRLGDVLRKNIPADREVPHGDFFNSQIQVRIAQEEMDRARESRTRAAGGGWLDWFRTPWFSAAATAAVALLAFAIWQNRGASPSGSSVVLSTYAPNPDVQARAFHSDDAEATVLMLDGLAALPADRKIVGHSVRRSETDQQMATTTLFSDDGQVLLVLAKDGRDQPRLLEHTP